jgi:hypothetical protein
MRRIMVFFFLVAFFIFFVEKAKHEEELEKIIEELKAQIEFIKKVCFVKYFIIIFKKNFVNKRNLKEMKKSLEVMLQWMI